MYKKYLLGIFSLLLLGTMFPTNVAQSQKDLDQRCFTQEECRAARAEMNLPIELQSQGFYYNTPETRTACQGNKDANGVEMGFCLPAGETSTTVKFGGVSKFANIGVFIQYIYRYGVVFAGILAVIVIIVAGLQWTSSGGNSSTIESAKKRIVGAITGLILASTSYVILNTVSPSTINLRLPQVWLIRPSPISNPYEYCMAIPAVPNGTTGWTVPKIAPFKDNYQSIPEAAFQDAFSTYGDEYTEKLIFPLKKESPIATCGENMYIKDSKGESCIGTYCARGVCFPDKKVCGELPEGSGIRGRIDWEPGKFLNDIWLKVACETDTGWEVEWVDHKDLDESKNFYLFGGVEDRAIDLCGSLEKIKGYFFIVEVNDSDPLNTNDDQWAGGRSFCRVPAGNSCGFYGANSVDGSDVEEWIGALATTGELFSPDEVHDQGLLCDFHITRKSMPNLGTGYVAGALSSAAYNFGNTAGKVADNLIGISPENILGNTFCPYLKNKEALFDKIIKERQGTARVQSR